MPSPLRSEPGLHRGRVALQALDEPLLVALLRTAVTDAEPSEVMPAPEPGWTPTCRRAFLEFHRCRGLAPEPVEATFVVQVDGRVAGAARLAPIARPGEVEAGIWLGRSWRRRGIGAHVLALLVEEAHRRGARLLVAETTLANAAARRILVRSGASLVSGAGDAVHARLAVDRLGDTFATLHG